MSDDERPTTPRGDAADDARTGVGDVPNPETGVGIGASDEGSTFEPEEDSPEGDEP